MVAAQVAAAENDPLPQARMGLKNVALRHEAVRAEHEARPQIGFRAREAGQSIAALSRNGAALGPFAVEVSISNRDEHFVLGGGKRLRNRLERHHRSFMKRIASQVSGVDGKGSDSAARILCEIEVSQLSQLADTENHQRIAARSQPPPRFRSASAKSEKLTRLATSCSEKDTLNSSSTARPSRICRSESQ